VSDEAALSEAKHTLLAALDSIEEIEAEMGAEISYVAVVYEVFDKTEEGNIAHSGGWNHSTAPDWVIATMLRRCADRIEEQPCVEEDE